MPIINRVSAMTDEISAWRQDLHEHPELMFEVQRTAGIVAEKLEEFGCDEIVTGIGRTGVVAVIKGKTTQSGKTIGLRADMDALPILENTGVPYASKTEGAMHACGHDGHTAMLLGAAKYLCETRNFDGTAIVIFQPAEEGGGGGDEMVKDGLMDRWGIQEVYGLHNMPGLPVGSFAIRSGAQLAAADGFQITVNGKGSHAARPQEGTDPILAAAHIVTALQSLVSRNTHPLESAVVTVTKFHGGDAFNVIPDQVKLTGTVRTLQPAIQDLMEKRITEVAEATASAFGTTARVSYKRLYPVTINHEQQTDFAASVATEIAGAESVNTDALPTMGAEDFAFMLNTRPGAFIFMGNGDSASLHNSGYNFNDEAIATGVSYWARLVETALQQSD